MAAGKLNLAIDQGATFKRTLTLSNDDGSPFNLTDYTFRAQARVAPQDAAPTITFTLASASPATGAIDISLTDAETAAIDCSGVKYPGKLVLAWDMEIEDTVSGEVTRVLYGSVNVSPEITK